MTDHTTTHLRPALAAALAWLHRTPQPDGAVLSHHGTSITVPEADRRLSVTPQGWNGRPVIVLAVLHPTHDPARPLDPPTNPLAPDELDRATTALADLGATVARTWNGHPYITGSLALAEPAHPTLVAAIDRYRAGCPTHPARSVFCPCGWYTTGSALIHTP